MLKTVDQLQEGTSYLLPHDLAQELISEGKAEGPRHPSPIGPSGKKPAGPSEVKKKKNA